VFDGFINILLRNIPEECRYRLHLDGSLEWGTYRIC